MLLDGLMSYASPAEVGDFLRSRKLEWQARIDSENTDDLRPPFKIEIWTASGYQIRELTGEVELRFFNDRLSRVRFVSSDPTATGDGIASAVEEEIGRRSRERVLSGTDGHGRGLVIIEDRALIEEEDDWIATYSIHSPSAPSAVRLAMVAADVLDGRPWEGEKTPLRARGIR